MSLHKRHLLTFLSNILFSFLIVSKWMKGYTLGYFTGTKNIDVVPEQEHDPKKKKHLSPCHLLLSPRDLWVSLILHLLQVQSRNIQFFQCSPFQCSSFFSFLSCSNIQAMFSMFHKENIQHFFCCGTPCPQELCKIRHLGSDCISLNPLSKSDENMDFMRPCTQLSRFC